MDFESFFMYDFVDVFLYLLRRCLDIEYNVVIFTFYVNVRLVYGEELFMFMQDVVIETCVTIVKITGFIVVASFIGSIIGVRYIMRFDFFLGFFIMYLIFFFVRLFVESRDAILIDLILVVVLFGLGFLHVNF